MICAWRLSCWISCLQASPFDTFLTVRIRWERWSLRSCRAVFNPIPACTGSSNQSCFATKIDTRRQWSNFGLWEVHRRSVTEKRAKEDARRDCWFWLKVRGTQDFKYFEWVLSEEKIKFSHIEVPANLQSTLRYLFFGDSAIWQIEIINYNNFINYNR